MQTEGLKNHFKDIHDYLFANEYGRHRRYVVIAVLLVIYMDTYNYFKKFFWYIKPSDRILWAEQILLSGFIPLLFLFVCAELFTNEKIYLDRKNIGRILLVMGAGFPIVVWAYNIEDWLILDVMHLNELMLPQSVGLRTYSEYYMLAIAIPEELLKIGFIFLFLYLYRGKSKAIPILGVPAVFVGFESILYATKGSLLERTWSILLTRFDSGSMTIHMATGLSILLVFYIMENSHLKTEKYLWPMLLTIVTIMDIYFHWVFNINAIIKSYGYYEHFTEPHIIAWGYFIFLAVAIYVVRYVNLITMNQENTKQKKFEDNLLT